MGQHADATVVHVVHNYIYANAAARTGATGFVAADIGKFARQTDDDSFYVLTATTPTWLQLGGGGDISGPGSSTDEAIARWNGAGGDTLQDSDVTIADDGSIIQSVEDAVTAAVTTIIQFIKTSTGTVADGFGVKRQTKLEDAAAATQVAMEEEVSWKNATTKFATHRLLLMSDGSLGEAMVISPAQFPDVLIGNARGLGAVDLQSERGLVTEVASGLYAVLIGGYENTASGEAAAVISGIYGEATGDTSLVIGKRNKASLSGQFAFGGRDYGVAGDAQGFVVTVGYKYGGHTENVWLDLDTDNYNGHLVIPEDHVWTVKVLLSGITADAANRWSAEINGMAVNDGGTVTVVSGTPDYIFRSDVNYEFRLSADTGNDALAVEIRRTTGGADLAIAWMATLLVTEVMY